MKNKSQQANHAVKMVRLLMVWLRLLISMLILLGTIFPIVLCQLLVVLLISPLFPIVSFRINQMLCGLWTYLFVIVTEVIIGIEIVFSGDRIRKFESAIQILNHVSFFDYWIMCSNVASRGLRGNAVRYFGKAEILYYFPFGTGLYLSGTVFIQRNWTALSHLVERAFQFMYSMPEVPIWLVIFPEGTRFTPTKREQSQQFARERKLKVLNHVLYPRHKGFSVTVRHIRPLLDAVYDITAVFPGNRYPTISNLIDGTYARKVYIDINRHPIDSIPESAEEIKTWIYDVWEKKDLKLEYFHTHGRFESQQYECPRAGMLINLWHGLFATRPLNLESSTKIAGPPSPMKDRTTILDSILNSLRYGLSL